MIETGLIAFSSHCWLVTKVRTASSRLMIAGKRGSRLRPSLVCAVTNMVFPVELRSCMKKESLVSAATLGLHQPQLGSESEHSVGKSQTYNCIRACIISWRSCDGKC